MDIFLTVILDIFIFELDIYFSRWHDGMETQVGPLYLSCCQVEEVVSVKSVPLESGLMLCRMPCCQVVPGSLMDIFCVVILDIFTFELDIYFFFAT